MLRHCCPFPFWGFRTHRVRCQDPWVPLLGEILSFHPSPLETAAYDLCMREAVSGSTWALFCSCACSHPISLFISTCHSPLFFPPPPPPARKTAEMEHATIFVALDFECWREIRGTQIETETTEGICMWVPENIGSHTSSGCDVN